MAQLLVRPPDELKSWLRILAKRKGLTINTLVLQILWDYFEAEKERNEK